MLDIARTAEVDTRAVRRDATRERIMEAAWELARDEGLAAVSLREVASRVGMRAPSLYTYFPSKNAIYDAMFAQGARELAETLAERAEGSDPEETVRNRARCFIAFCLRDPLRYQLIFERPVPGFEPEPESFAITVGALAGTRADLQVAGLRGEPELDLYRALINGLISQQVANDPGGDRWARLLDDALDMFFAHHLGSRRNRARPARAKGQRR